MSVKEIIEKRRAYRSLQPFEVTKELIDDLVYCASLAPSCMNNQPWRFVFVYDRNLLEQILSVMPKGNQWAKNAGMIIAVFSKKDMDCVLEDNREYFLFDMGMATAFLILRATELGLVAHPIAGYDPVKVKEILGIPQEMVLIALVIVGKKSEEISPLLSEKQILGEKQRPERLPFEKIAFINRYSSSE
ncbi:MAG: nitroreductase family protein [candidate division WOR-3 bacterium]